MDRDGDRRSGQRFEIRQEVRYRAAVGRREINGCGHTLNISSSGILFAGDQPLPQNAWVTAEIGWPVLLDQRKPIKLVTHGKVVRVQRGLIAVQIRDWEFRTASTASHPESSGQSSHGRGSSAGA
ncbi:MAG: PilZ domain-containing protein [Bryobacteraceae bacterium]|nr:PilZ domain-containing protein [Bryobacteraceae bacterium]